MVLSAHNASAAQAAAAALGLQFTAVHDGRLNATEVADALVQLAQHPDTSIRASAVVLQGSQSLCSPALVERDALRHFPTAWVVRAANAPSASDLAIIGAMPAFAWAISLRQRLEQP